MDKLKTDVEKVIGCLNALETWQKLKILEESQKVLKNNYEKIKVNPVQMKVHPEFRDDFVAEEVKQLKEYREDVTALLYTKVIMNFFKANPKYKSLINNVIKNGK